MAIYRQKDMLVNLKFIKLFKKKTKKIGLGGETMINEGIKW